ncbi:tRNA (adenosine(37)-N6)-threonylcarbamoyltransferase complex dimerization subunit type 1 TsaB [Tuberibacillus calidus]|jgi:tRNA threonylcarbamoyladenosine biosynthesis protein TsaB|uniref:tRNA (adenosine(37)-N6)-threonylcarbamoyltransferase complex dimerization subunit type 1 TsaB n=1 Tax=Tuberibacillus calidus TaxID=340097 RepID=UPI0003FA96DD|nr:tRNA (adenosine(37)-N6)-threonylcarbamoyltransferase complex dimerization subunit type 1 TsaB [Tuberibacillus calidus]
MNVLAIDSSNVVMGVAITKGDTVLGELITNSKKNHSVRLMLAIEQLFIDAGIKPEEIDRIAVAEGPGSYTGVRIGVTIAKTMAWAMKKELVGLSSLEILAQNGLYFNGYLCPLFDARRGQVYTGLYRSNSTEVQAIESDRLILLTDWLAQLQSLDQPILFLGNDLALHWDRIQAFLGRQAVRARYTENNPRPSTLAFLAQKYPPVEAHAFTPRYLQLAEAEAKWLAKQEQKGQENGSLHTKSDD